MNRLLQSLLRPAAYGAAAIGALAALTHSRQQDNQQQQQRNTQLIHVGRVTPVHSCSINRLSAASASASSGLTDQPAKNYREERFLEFASVEYEGVPYMTPADFLESVTQERPRHRQRRKALSKHELDRMLSRAPHRKLSSIKLLRNLGHDGIVSYPEYLFLLCTLSNANSGFAIAFSMIDRSRNQNIEKAEFAMLNAMVSNWNRDHNTDEPGQDTTLMRYFFGRSGKHSLEYADFVNFMSSLQHEVLEIEFMEFSNGMPTIPESDFARILLRYTNLSARAQAQYVQQVKEKIVRDEGIEFEDFRLFFQFINSLKDMATALRMYALAGHSVTQEEFQRAVKACVGYTLAPKIVSTVFLLFDKDGDGSLSSEEFLGILRDRLRRLNPKPRSSATRTGDFKKCLKREIQKDAPSARS